MSKKNKQNKNTVQELLGIDTFSKFGLKTAKGELVFFSIAPTNISVLSYDNIALKIWHLTQVLSAQPDIEIICLDSCEKFDNNKIFLRERLKNEKDERVRSIIQKDLEQLDTIQLEMSSARLFVFGVRFRREKPEQIFTAVNRCRKVIAEQGFEVRQLNKAEIKRLLAVYYGASAQGEMIPDYDGEDAFDLDKLENRSD